MHDDLPSAQDSSLPITTPSSPAVTTTDQPPPLPKAAPKFRNPENPTETWMGRGKRPNWLKAQLAAGRKLEDFRINDE